MEPPLGQHQETLMAAASHISPLEDMLVCGPKQEQRTNNNSKQAGNKLPQPEQPLRCPRCDSTNTKFCYYNNYSLSQPRYFCKSCRRYWTKGGTLRNVPVGGGCRKNKRPSSSFLSKRPNNPHVDPQFSAVGSEVNSIPLINSFPMDHGLDQFGGGSHSQKRFDPDHDLSFLGSLGLHGMMGNPSAASPSVSIPGFFDSIRNELFHEGQHHRGSFLDMYQGLDNSARDVQGLYEEMGTGVPKRETMSGLENESRVLWGFPWNGNSEEVDYARSSGGSWNGINSTAANWQGLINSSMM